MLAALYLPFLWRLLTTTRELFILAGVIFVGGGVVLFIYALLDSMRRIDMVVVFNPKH